MGIQNQAAAITQFANGKDVMAYSGEITRTQNTLHPAFLHFADILDTPRAYQLRETSKLLKKYGFTENATLRDVAPKATSLLRIKQHVRDGLSLILGEHLEKSDTRVWEVESLEPYQRLTRSLQMLREEKARASETLLSHEVR